MNINAWMPLQGAEEQRYGYAAKKSEKTSSSDKGTEKTSSFAKTAENDWQFPTESYVPSVEAQEYKAQQNTTTQSTDNQTTTKLSEKAQKLLEELKEKYSNMDFFVASYSSEEEAQQYLNQGTKEYSVLIDPETLEEMANDESVRAQYEDILSGAGDTLETLKEQLGEDADNVKSLGISIDKDGTVSYFAQLDKISESREKQLEKAKEKKAEKKKEESKKAEKEKLEEQKEESLLKASSVEELLEKIKTALADSEESETSVESETAEE